MRLCYRGCAADARAAEDTSKKWGMLNLVNQLFKIYFKVKGGKNEDGGKGKREKIE